MRLKRLREITLRLLSVQQLPLRWWFSALTACLGAFAGLLGSIYSNEIKEAFPFVWDDGPIVWPAVLFWTSLLIFGLFFGLGFRAQNEATNKLEQMIRTLPPRGFLATFEDLFRFSFEVDAKARESQDSPVALHGTISTALIGVASLADAFDARDDRPRYSVNIMLFRPINEFSDKANNEIIESIKFAEPGYNTDTWDGVLQLQTEFAYSLVEGARESDTGALSIMLPIPKAEFRIDRGKSTILPGAPAVYCDPSRFVGFENTLQLANWCREYSALRESVAEEIEDYFANGAGKEIRSFISIPIVLPAAKSGELQKVLGVLNLHSNREGFLPGEKAGLFVPLTSPFMLLIARCLDKYRTIPLDKRPKGTLSKATDSA